MSLTELSRRKEYVKNVQDQEVKKQLSLRVNDRGFWQFVNHNVKEELKEK